MLVMKSLKFLHLIMIWRHVLINITVPVVVSSILSIREMKMDCSILTQTAVL